MNIFNKMTFVICFLLNAYEIKASDTSSFSTQTATATIASSSSSSSSCAPRGKQKRKAFDESEESGKNIFLADRALLIGKVQVIKNELKRLLTLSNNQFVRNFVLTLVDDTEKIRISNSEETVEELKSISAKLDQIKVIKGITKNDIDLIENIQQKLLSLYESYKKNLIYQHCKSQTKS